MMKIFISSFPQWIALLCLYFSQTFNEAKADDCPSDNKMPLTCYYRWQGNWSYHLTPDKIDPFMCTHIIIGFVGVDNSTISVNDDDIIGYKWTASLKKKNPALKVMVSIGGSTGFSEAAASAKNREKFINSIISFLRKCDLDGVDIDWEFPVWSDDITKANPDDKPNLTMLLKEFKIAAQKESPGCPPLISVAVAGPKTIIDVAYDIPGMSIYADFINLMSYDYNDYHWYTPYTAHNAPLFSNKLDIGYFATLNTAWSANYWVEKGMNKSKLYVAIPLYTHTYELVYESQHGVKALASSSSGTDYPWVCQFLNESGTGVFDAESKVPYAYRGKEWVSYEDEESAKIKTNWIMDNGFGGIMTFSLNTDDWEGSCDGKTKFPLMSVIKRLMHP